jgi:hypothetical protein
LALVQLSVSADACAVALMSLNPLSKADLGIYPCQSALPLAGLFYVQRFPWQQG